MKQDPMPLAALGFDAWFEERAAARLQPGHALARVTAVDRGAFLLRTGEAEYRGELAGRIRVRLQSAVERPCVGDWVCVQRPSASGPAIIHDVLPRKTILRRKSAGRSTEFQLIAANVDVAFIVQGCAYDFNVRRLARYLVMVTDGGIEPRIVLSKTDLVSEEELKRRTEEIGAAGITVPVLPLSSATGDGLEALRNGLAPGRTCCLLGSSGVGKTTLINRLLGEEAFETKAVSETGEGVHTTARRQLLLLDGGAMLIDTPGMRELGVLGASGGIEATFSDLEDYATQCRFPDCTHTREPGCAVLQAVKDGVLSDAYYRDYLKLRKESEYHDLSYLEKRRKDRSFGRFIKSAKKQMRK